MEFFVHQNGETAGPFSRETVERMNLDPGTLVWHEGMPTWLPAAEVEELADLYRPGPGSVRPQECPAATRILPGAARLWHAAALHTPLAR